MSFVEYVAWRQRKDLPDSATMLGMAGISPSAPHEVDLLKLLKAWKKGRPRRDKQPFGLANPAPQIDSMLATEVHLLTAPQAF